MAYKIKQKKSKKLDKEDKWLKDWYKMEKEATKNPFL
jgi:hypothetical protein